MIPRVYFFHNKISVESFSSKSAQAKVFFGRETNLSIKVVLKQYKTNLKGLYRELKLFTELERLKHEAKRF